jgi:LPS-assembly protein
MLRTGDKQLGMRRVLPGIAASYGLWALGMVRTVWTTLCALVLAVALTVPVTETALAASRSQTQSRSNDKAALQQRQQLAKSLQVPRVKSSEPMLLQADQMIYDNDNGRITAKGNVELYYGNYTLLSDSLVYDRNANTLNAIGNVRIKDPDGAVITADHITLTDDFRDGFLNALQLVTKDDTRIVAQSASREAGNVTVFQKGWFTPCKICEDNPSKPPTWRIRAGKIVHRRDQATLTFNNAWFDFFGVPMVYVPWFQMADPTVRRKSGFLIPSYSHDTQLGNTVTVPYYFALSDHYDLTFAPMYTENAGTLLVGDWRQRTASGGFRLQLQGVWDPGYSGSFGDFRGGINTQGKFALDPYYSWGWDIITATDDTFRRFYNLDTKIKTDRIDQVFLEGLHDRNYLSTRFYSTNSLLSTNEPFSDAAVFPIIDYDYIVKNPIIGGELSFNSNMMAFENKDNLSSDRLISEANWRRQMIDGIGEVFTPFFQLRGDLYNVSGVNAISLAGTEDLVTQDPTNGFTARGNAVAGLEYRYPFVATTGSVTHVIEPIGQIIARPASIGNQQDVPNEDALSLVFDDTLLFDIDKFSGYDRVETGTRANVGFRYTAELASGAYARGVFGQSYQIAGQNAYDTAFYSTSGLATDDSDFVGGLYLQTSSYLGFSAQSRFDHNTFDIKRADLGSSAQYGPIRAIVNYADVTSEPGLAANQPRQEVLAGGSLALTTDWSLLGNLRYDLQADQPITEDLGLQYQDDCYMMNVIYERSFVHDQDIKPDERFLVNFMLKYIGGYSLTTNADFLGTQSASAFGP